MSQEFSVADDTFEELRAIADKRGITLEEWIAAKVKEERPQTTLEARPLSEMLDGLVGVIDSSGEPRLGYPDTEFTRGLVEKYEKQGLTLERQSRR